MGQKQTRTTRTRHVNDVSTTSPFKLFEYQCPTCNSKRPIQYFHRNETFLPQAPRVVCGECNTSVAVEPFKTVEYNCPWCKKWHKVRLPAKPMPIKMYNISVATCNCGFRGEVPVGRLMDVSCSQCWSSKRELRGVWTEHNDEIKTYCETCQGYQRGFAREPKRKTEQNTDMEYTCENCFRQRPIGAEELLRNQGLASCSLCGWVGYPEVVPKGQLASKGQPESETKPHRKSDRGRKRSPSEKSKRNILPSLTDKTKMQSPVPDLA
jgi:transcription elongation factor Elf1